jgi:hypothetical protein
MTGGVVLVHEPRKPNLFDIRDLIACAVDAFCEEFGISGAADRKCVFERISIEARDMAAEIPEASPAR